MLPLFPCLKSKEEIQGDVCLFGMFCLSQICLHIWSYLQYVYILHLWHFALQRTSSSPSPIGPFGDRFTESSEESYTSRSWRTRSPSCEQSQSSQWHLDKMVLHGVAKPAVGSFGRDLVNWGGWIRNCSNWPLATGWGVGFSSCKLIWGQWTTQKKCSPRTRMLTRMLMVQMSKHMDMQSRRTLLWNRLFEQSCTCSPCYHTSAPYTVGYGRRWRAKCGVWSVESGV